MVKLIVSVGMVLLLVIAVGVFARAAPEIAYDWDVSDLGQGCRGGGPLYADGSAGGTAACSFADGRVTGTLVPISWSSPSAGRVLVCFNVVTVKGFSPSIQCLGPAPVNGEALQVSFPGDGHPNFIQVQSK